MLSIAFDLMLLLTWSSGGAVGRREAPRAPLRREVLPPIPIALHAPTGTDALLVNRICEETDAIWEPAGISFDWHIIAAKESPQPGQLDVTIEDRRRDLSRWQAAVGWITFTADGPEPSIHLSRLTAEDLLLRTAGLDDTTIAAHEELVGRALGRALSHEIGHYLLKSKVHTPHGLMRAIWSANEFFDFRRNGFKLTAEESQTAVQHAQHEF